ncbi:MAG TPA: ChbG/HpnK family deacetylase, partial [Terriglobia bacterium]|nr:ChbG/HpnK family deacetylase [Terriglobia bacterium]
IRAQIERALAMGIHPTHLDMHMGTLAARPDYYAALIEVAHEYKLPFLAVHVPDARNQMMSMLSDRDILLDSLVMFNPGVPPAQWTASYAKALAAIKPGVHYLIVHLGYDDAELQAITEGHPDYGAAWRERDLHAVESPEFKKALEDNHIILIGWKDLKKLL